MNNEEKNENQNIPKDEQRLKYEVEQAFLRKKFKQPILDEEWQKFSSRTINSTIDIPKNKHNLLVKRVWIISLSTAAAMLIAFFSFYNSENSIDVHSTTINMARKTGAAIVLEEEVLGSTIPKTTYIEHATKSQENKGVVFSSELADYTNTIGTEAWESRLSTPAGQVYKVILNDGTKVWINAESKLIFPSRFDGDKRMVRLEGEAFFEVAHNKDKPFFVETEKFVTEVLGTEFSVKSYDYVPRTVTLITGSVKVKVVDTNKEVLLKPGENIAYTNSGYKVSRVDTDNYTLWKDGYFYFDNVYLADILKEVGRWYNLNIEMEESALLRNLKMHFVAERSETIEQVIENLNRYEHLVVTVNKDGIFVRLKK